jgi:hypothetical protein
MSRAGWAEAGAVAGIAGLVVFLALHHLWVVPIWFIAPVGAVMAAAGGAAVGAAYVELLPQLPRRPLTVLAVVAGVAAMLVPSIVFAELGGPMYDVAADGEAALLVPVSDAVTAFVIELLATTTLAGAVLGGLVGRTRRATATTALAGFALAVGPGHNIPLLGGTSAATRELVILAVVALVASVVLVEAHAWLARRSIAALHAGSSSNTMRSGSPSATRRRPTGSGSRWPASPSWTANCIPTTATNAFRALEPAAQSSQELARMIGPMVDVAVSGTIRAAPGDVFRFLVDLENWPRWQSDMKSTALAEGQRGELGAVYRYLSRAMGMTFDSTVRRTRVDAPREVAFEGGWTGMIRPNGRYLVEPAPEGSRVTLNPRPEVRGIGRLMEPVIAAMGRRLNREHLEALRKELEKG